MTKQKQNLSIHGYVSGKVQGVSFRDATRKVALQHQVNGWAKNLSDGRVEVLLSGKPESVRTVLDWLHKGPPAAEVSGVQHEEVAIEAVPGFITC